MSPDFNNSVSIKSLPTLPEWMPLLAPSPPRSNPAGQAGSAEPPRPQAVFPKCDPLAPQAAGDLSGKAPQRLISCIYQRFSGYMDNVHVDSGDRQIDPAGKVRDRGMLGYA
jgi:hypothetical protein